MTTMPQEYNVNIIFGRLFNHRDHNQRPQQTANNSLKIVS